MRPRRCRTTLREELGVDVGGEVASLEIQILDHDPDLAGRSERAISPPQPPGSAEVANGFVGRTAALQWLVGRDGVSGVRLIAGTPGVGKTELLREAANRMAASPGAALVLTTRCRESLSGADPLAPAPTDLGSDGW